MHRPPVLTFRPASTQSGLTLVEMMIALILGLIIIGAASAVYLSNRQAWVANGSLGDIQNSARIAYTLLARDVRQAGGTGCGDRNLIVNKLASAPVNGGHEWYADFPKQAVKGFDDAANDPAINGGSITPVAGSSSLRVIGIAPWSATVGDTVGPASAFNLAQNPSSFESGDIVSVCNPGRAAIVRVSNYAAPVLTFANAINCPMAANAAFGCQGALVSRLLAGDWFIGTNPQGNKSLYRLTLTAAGGVPKTTTQEMVRNVINMKITYHESSRNDFEPAEKVGNRWSDVTAVHLDLTVRGLANHAGTDQNPIKRQVTGTITLRNRV